MKKSHIYRIIFLILSITVATTIFIFSNQNGTKSKSTSRKVMRQIIEIWPSTKNLSEKQKQQLVEKSQPAIRKAAHFTIYTLLGINILIFLKTFNINNKKQIIYTLILCMIYATSDEIHQMFTDDRSPMILDILIDTLGATFGTLIVTEITRLINKKQKQPQKNVENSWKNANKYDIIINGI